MVKRISNPIFNELIDINLIKKINLKIISKKTRDKKMDVYQDEKSRIILLQKYSKNNFYKNKNVSLKKFFNDDLRRYNKFKNLIGNKKILDFGCGWGGFLNKFKNKKNKFGVEIRKECIKYINYNLKFKVFNNLSEINQKFDFISLFHVLEHIPNQIIILKKIRKKLKKDGKIIIEVPHAKDFLIETLNLKSFKNFTFWSEHLILHTEESLCKILNIAGFKVVNFEYLQRYNINNHFKWIIENKPNGHNDYKGMFNDKIKKRYIQFLQNIKQTDTILVTAKAN